MSTGPATPDPGQDDDSARRPGEPAEPDDGPENWRELPASHQDWLTEDEWIASLSQTEPEDWIYPGDDPGDDAEDDPGGFPQPGAAGPRAAAGGRVPQGTGRGAKGAVTVPKGGRRGPGQPGSARRVPGASPGPAGSFATGHTLDTAPGGAALHALAEYAAGPDDRFPGTTDDELTGIICALDRTEAAACALKHAAVAELIRRRPAPDREPALAGPGNYEEFTSTELAWALAETRWAAESILDLSLTLQEKLPGTYAQFRAGILRESKAASIARGVTALTPAEARAAEAKVLDRAGRLTPGRLRAVVKQAVIAVAPDKAVKRRKDQTADPATAGTTVPPTSGMLPMGFAGHLNLTTPLSTLVDKAERPGEIAGIGPIDPDLARDFATAAATNPRTTWCVTVTDEQGHAIGHGCARPNPETAPAPIPRDPPPPDHPAATTPGSSSGTSPRSGTPLAPPRPAAAPPRKPTSNTTSRSKTAAKPASATGDPSAVTTIGSNSTPGGTPSRSPPGSSGGPPPQAASTPPSRPDIPSDRYSI